MQEVPVVLRQDEWGHYKWEGRTLRVGNNANEVSKANKDKNPLNLEFSFPVGGRLSFRVWNRK